MTTVLGRQSVSTLYFGITERFNLPLVEFERRPMEMLQHLKELVGVAAFALLEQKINSSLKIVFEIKEDKTIGLPRMIELAKKSYLSAEM
ncbi:MAG TPA: hypothetical protein VNE86_00695 [Nitrososphaerales archaeon]|nr:hypothetical protein [Nitrososphaerales archaeon]